MQRDDLQLTQRLAQGDDAAFEQIVAAHQDVVVRLARAITGDDAAAHDAAQEAFIRLWRNPGAFTGGSLRAWLCAVARNLALNELRGGKRRALRHERREASDAPTPPPMKAEDREKLAQVRAFIDTLPEQERSALVLYAVEGLEQSEVAQALETTPAAIKQAVLSARKKLREKFGE
ncbi:ECF RNA polymerase sigma factor SigE [Planctomycetaceae bacterium]|nr:ECF RNA polymerase sigma factor SigE [Planctomycetaceae bacterium]